MSLNYRLDRPEMGSADSEMEFDGAEYDIGRIQQTLGEAPADYNKDSMCNMSCGEGGCADLFNTGIYGCYCIHMIPQPDPMLSPDEHGRCPMHETDVSLPPLDHALLNNDLLLDDSDVNPANLKADQPAIDPLVMQIGIPTLAIFFVLLAVLLIVYHRTKRTRQFRALATESPVSWLHGQDRDGGGAVLLDRLTVMSKNPNYFASDMDSAFVSSLQTTQISRDHLKILDGIGEGAFGKVFRGELMCPESGDSTCVAIKMLKPDATKETRDDFRREVSIMVSFEHDNILKLLGVITVDDEPPYMVFEYMEYGDLADLLRKNDPLIGENKSVQLKQVELVDIATQIANGMKYLASKHFVHRDLATRNCLVGSELIVKISDFGMSRDIYTCDYYKIGGARMLPVRWMSAESVKYGRFTTESDVWAYGVVLWEIFSYGKQPYYGHSNEEVIHFIEDEILLQKPSGCPTTIDHVMIGCWRRDPKDRFTFEKIHRHLVEYAQNVMECGHQMKPVEYPTGPAEAELNV